MTGAGYSNKAVGFRSVTAFGGGKDVATLTGAGFGTNTLSGFLGSVTLTGTKYFIEAEFFSQVTAISKSASDVATLYGNFNVTNTLLADATHASLNGAGTTNVVSGFHQVTAYSFATDIAYLYGPSTGSNRLVAAPTSTYLIGTGYWNTANGYHTVYAFSASSSDQALFSGLGGSLFVTPTTAQMSGKIAEKGYFVQAANYRSICEYLTSQPFHLNSNGTTMQLLNQNNAVIDSGLTTAAVGPLLNANFVWAIGSNGIRYEDGGISGEGIMTAQSLNGLTDSNLRSVLFHDMVRDGGTNYNGMLDAFAAIENEGAVSVDTLAVVPFSIATRSSNCPRTSGTWLTTSSTASRPTPTTSTWTGPATWRPWQWAISTRVRPPSS